MKKKRTKKYQPKPINPHAAHLAIHLAKPIADKAKQTLQSNARIALDVFVKGMPEVRHYEDLGLLADLTLLLSGKFFEEAYMAEINEAQGALLRARDRYEKHGKFGLDGIGIEQLKTVIAIHCEQLEQITGKEYMDMIDVRKKLIAQGNVYSSEQDRLQKMGIAA